MEINTFTYIGLPRSWKPSVSTNGWLIRPIGTQQWSIVSGDTEADAIVAYCDIKGLFMCTGQIINIGVIDEIY